MSVPIPRLLCGCLLILASTSFGKDLEVAKTASLAVVDAAIEHHGGALFDASRSSFEVCSKSGCSAVSVTMNGGLFEYDVTATVRGTERRVRSTNEALELWEDGESVAVDDPRRRQSLRDWAMQRVYFNFLPFRLNDPSVYKQDLGIETWGDRRLHKVKISFAPGSSTDASDEYLYWFDPESSRLELFAYSYGGGLRFRRLFDYRRVGGLLFYNQENWGVEGEGLSVDSVTPQYVEAEMRHVSTIELRVITVDSLN
jgi:hypothetical protein